MDVNSLARMKWNCKYYVVFVQKFRRKIMYNQLKEDKLADNLSSKEYIYPFIGKRIKQFKLLNCK